MIQDKRNKEKEALGGGGAGGGRARSKKEKSASAGGNAKSKRPLSAFFTFCKESREAHAAAGGEGGDGGTGPSLKAKDLAERWKALSEEGREGYVVASAAALKEWKAGNAEDAMVASSSSSSSSSSGGGRRKSKAPIRSASSSKKKPSGNKGDEDNKRPKSAYILFTSERRPKLKAEHGYPPAVMMSKLAEEWRDMEGSAEREVYVRRAAEMKEQWLTAKEGGGGVAAVL